MRGQTRLNLGFKKRGEGATRPRRTRQTKNGDECFMSRGKVLISGFLINLDCPSEERLAAHVDLSGLAGYRHMDWVGSLQDLLRNVDADYRREKLGKEEKTGDQMLHRGRSVRVRYVKDGQGQQRKVASFQPYPSMIVNHFKELRRKVYDALNENCLILQEERIGRMKRKLYFLPANIAAEIMLHVEELNNLLNALKIDVKDFEASQRFDVQKLKIDPGPSAKPSSLKPVEGVIKMRKSRDGRFVLISVDLIAFTDDVKEMLYGDRETVRFKVLPPKPLLQPS